MVNQHNLYNPITREVIIQYRIYSPGGKIITGTTFATIPSKYRPLYSISIDAFTIINNSLSFAPDAATLHEGGPVYVSYFLNNDNRRLVIIFYHYYI